jgi:hypothetical protein
VLISGWISEVIDGTWGGFKSFVITYHWLYLIAFLGAGFFSGLIAFFAYKDCASTRCKLAEEIFHLLGMKNTATVNLNKITKEREQSLIDEGKWHSPEDQSKPACPSRGFIYSRESWFYY